MENELKACPFCGGIGQVAPYGDHIMKMVNCSDCGATIIRPTKEDAIKFWNASQPKRKAEQPIDYTWNFSNEDEILAHVAILYREYGLCPDEQLTEDAKKLKRKVLAALEGMRQPEREAQKPIDCLKAFDVYFETHKNGIHRPDAEYWFENGWHARQPEREAVNRTYPRLLSEDDKQSLLQKAECLWRALEENKLGGFSGINRPFFIFEEFKEIIENYGERDIGLTWSTDDLRKAKPKEREAAIDELSEGEQNEVAKMMLNRYSMSKHHSSNSHRADIRAMRAVLSALKDRFDIRRRG